MMIKHYIPHGYAHGYSVLSEFAIVVYLQSENYVPESEIIFTHYHYQ